ncbi:hypothetical protein AVEN_157907-1 [Araneus ventricosus]|uniref:Uncharacterized protein n=1 Tax=Araneus ventricosus TaxID=182803 RepID=A0A4Y2FK02_ARAVE|nr:hypothetical protein AVEN_157907-1 [Araneus ventricosus]
MSLFLLPPPLVANCHNFTTHSHSKRDIICGRPPIPWPPRSPVLAALDFFWGYIKNIVYSENITDISHLKRRIIAAIETVTPQMLHNTWRLIDYRLDVCRATNGAHIETY